jgi:hypothetical protein
VNGTNSLGVERPIASSSRCMHGVSLVMMLLMLMMMIIMVVLMVMMVVVVVVMMVVMVHGAPVTLQFTH